MATNSKLQAEIKSLSSTQRELKNQRKTVSLVGERTVEPQDAQWKHLSNRYKLRILYAAYGLLRGKTFSQIENKYDEANHPLKQFSTQINSIQL